MAELVTLAGHVGDGDRLSVYRTLCRLDTPTLVVRSADRVFVDIARMAARDSQKHFASLPTEVELDAENESVWVFGEVACEQSNATLLRYRNLGLQCSRWVI